MKPLTTCANGDGRPIQPPSLVICKVCLDKIGATLRELLATAKREQERRDAD